MGLFSRKRTSGHDEKLINDLAVAQVVGRGFSSIVQAGRPVANFHWLNAAAAAGKNANLKWLHPTTENDHLNWPHPAP